VKSKYLVFTSPLEVNVLVDEDDSGTECCASPVNMSLNDCNGIESAAETGGGLVDSTGSAAPDEENSPGTFDRLRFAFNL
jgi:hypothetical protein